MRALILSHNLFNSKQLRATRGVNVYIEKSPDGNGDPGILSVTMHQAAIPAEMLRFAKKVEGSPPEMPLRRFEFQFVVEDGVIWVAEPAKRTNDRLHLILYFMERWSIPVEFRE